VPCELATPAIRRISGAVSPGLELGVAVISVLLYAAGSVQARAGCEAALALAIIGEQV